MTYLAGQLYDKTRGLGAFNFDKSQVTRTVKNQHGVRYWFVDGSSVYFDKQLAARLWYPNGLCMATRIGVSSAKVGNMIKLESQS